jgi:hypothetical protein
LTFLYIFGDENIFFYANLFSALDISPYLGMDYRRLHLMGESGYEEVAEEMSEIMLFIQWNYI